MNVSATSAHTPPPALLSAPSGGLRTYAISGLVETDITRCLTAWLAVLDWAGSQDDLLAALPHANSRPDLTEMRNALARLGHPTRGERLRQNKLDARRLPGLLIEGGQPACLLYRASCGTVFRLDGATGDCKPCAHWNLSGTLYLAAPVPPVSRGSWLGAVARRFAPEAATLLAISAMITLLGLAVPIFTMVVFDTVVAGRAPGVLPMLAMGAIFALAMEVAFRALRQRALARIGERLDRLVPTAVFGQLMALPNALVERAGTAAQVSRLRDFAAIRDFLTGAFALAVLDLPFSLLVLALLLFLGGWVAVEPLAAACGLALLYLATRGAVSRAINEASRAGQAREALALEALEAHRGLKLMGAEARWVERYAAAAAAAATASARASSVSGQVMTVSQAMVTLSGMVALLVGVVAVLANGMSAGTLIAGMMLIWRVLGPLQTSFVMLSRWEQTRASIRQVDGMMALETERPPMHEVRMAPPQRGDIVFQRVSLRYLSQAEPVLSGASFAIRHGEVIAITGADGAGKSTIMKMVAGLYRPQGGVVRLDGHDIRAFDPAVLRRAVAWVPQAPDLLYGTIAQNLRLAMPSASDEALREAADAAHVLAAIEALPEGFETRVGDNSTAQLPRSLLLRITLARALLRNAPVLLLDEPATGLDDACADAFAEVIADRRGHATILMATHRPSHARLADRVLRIQDGQVEDGTPPAAAASAPLARMPVFASQGFSL
ncbi:MAG: ATP-binding cassette domain-containing protein [Pseudomonadota bacterium]